MRRTAENGAGAVVHQNEIRYVDRQLPGRIEWMHSLDTGVEAEFLGLVDFRLGGSHAVALLDEGGELRVFCRRGLCQRMIRRQRHELGAEQGVRPRGENFQFALFVRCGCGIERKT